MIEIENITKVYQMGETEVRAVDGVSLKIQDGEWVAITGPSGSGKSTLMAILGCLDSPTSGAYKLDAIDVAKMRDDQLASVRNKKIGFVFQQFNLLPRTSALKQVALPLTYAGYSRRDRFERAETVLRAVGLGDRLDHRPDELSGGQQLDKGVRKIREWITAIQIEKNFTKNEIIELYLNVSYLGRSAYGIEAASRVYFNKSSSELTLPESALFVALLKSPRDFDPVNNYDNALKRRNLVMYNMVSAGFLGKDEYDKLKEEPIVLGSEKPNVMRTVGPHFMEYVRLQLSDLADKYGYDMYRDGLNIYTSIDIRMQRIANEVAAKHIQEYQKLFDKNWSWNKNKDLLATLIDEAIKKSREYRSVESQEKKAAIYNRLKKNEAFIDSIKFVATRVEVGFVGIDPVSRSPCRSHLTPP